MQRLVSIHWVWACTTPRLGHAVPLQDSAGKPLPDDQALLNELRVEKTSLGQVAIGATPASYEQHYPANVRFGDNILLNGYDFEHNDHPILSADDLLGATRYDYLNYVLSWMGLQAMKKEYTGFVHLVDAKGKLLVQDDHPVGSSRNSTSQWRLSDQQLDHYELQVPREAPAGVYWPIIGVYDPDTTDLLTVQGEGGEALGDVYKLPPIKILTVDPNFKPLNETGVKIGDLGVLLGYELDLPEEGIRPGSQFTATLYYKTEAPSPKDLTRFVHLADPTLGMAAQADSQPDDGKNPTWSWAIPGEVVVDPVRLTVAADAAPGVYSLRVGLYDPETGTRLPLQDSAGKPLPDDQVILTDLRVEE